MYGLHSIKYHRSSLWNNVPIYIRVSQSNSLKLILLNNINLLHTISLRFLKKSNSLITAPSAIYEGGEGFLLISLPMLKAPPLSDCWIIK